VVRERLISIGRALIALREGLVALGSRLIAIGRGLIVVGRRLIVVGRDLVWSGNRLVASGLGPGGHARSCAGARRPGCPGSGSRAIARHRRRFN
jgi:hypothetical protein